MGYFQDSMKALLFLKQILKMLAAPQRWDSRSCKVNLLMFLDLRYGLCLIIYQIEENLKIFG